MTAGQNQPASPLRMGNRGVAKGCPPHPALAHKGQGVKKPPRPHGHGIGAGRAPYLRQQPLHGVFLPYQLVELLLTVHRVAAPARAGEIFCHVAEGLAFFFKGLPLPELRGTRSCYRRGACGGRQPPLGEKETKGRGRQRRGVMEERRDRQPGRWRSSARSIPHVWTLPGPWLGF